MKGSWEVFMIRALGGLRDGAGGGGVRRALRINGH